MSLWLTEEEIDAAKSPRGGWTKAQLATWGVPWPPPKGWRQALINGQPIPGSDAEKAESLREAAAKARHAADDPRLGARDCEPFWQAADLLDRCATIVDGL